MKKIIALLALSFFVAGCSFLIKNFGDESYEVLDMDRDHLSLVFSHNVNGETHPCGCRHFPLGGLPQLAGILHELKKSDDVLYVDTGDMLFPSMVIPKSVRQSLTFAAENLARGMDNLGLKYFVPGDQDFALGWDFLRKIANNHNFEFLISNLKNPEMIKHKEWALIKKGPHRVFLLGLVQPETMGPQYENNFTNVDQALSKMIKKLKDEEGYNPKSPFHRLIVLSHAGMPNDETLAKKFDNIDWIIGAHSQSFTKYPVTENKTQIVQVLSRNHYMGNIKITFKNGKKKDKFDIIENRDSWRTKLSPNPFEEFIDQHKTKLSQIQLEEQQNMAVKSDTNIPISTTASCLDCHTKQTAFYQKTPHSLAYATLINIKEERNLQCVKCHSVGLNNMNGFSKTSEIIKVHEGSYKIPAHEREKLTEEEANKKEQAKLAQIKKNYWREVKKSFGHIKSVRKLSKVRLLNESTKWLDLDEKYKLTYNYANVQCRNCHTIPLEHPYDSSASKVSKSKRYNDIKKQCLKCHDPDQSPEWYKVDANGLPGKLEELKFVKRMKSMACPRSEE